MNLQEFHRANLAHANLSDTKLYDTNFTDTNLEAVNFTNAKPLLRRVAR
ncbi:MAG: pentapeptide repeat-containing protein [Coleofasciculus sp. G3-WIS-01]